MHAFGIRDAYPPRPCAARRGGSQSRLSSYERAAIVVSGAVDAEANVVTDASTINEEARTR